MFVYVVENCTEWLQATMRPLQWRIGIENGEPSQDLDGVGRGDMSMLIPDGDWSGTWMDVALPSGNLT